MKPGRMTMLVATLLGGVLASAPAQAAYVIDIEQVGADVVTTGRGSVNLSALTEIAPWTAVGFVNPAIGWIAIGGGDLGFLWGGNLNGPDSFGTGDYVVSLNNGGGVFGLIRQLGVIVPRGYVSGTNVGDSSTAYKNSTFASLGMTPGTYTWTWGSGASADSLTMNIGLAPPAVPEPATWAMVIAGFALIGSAMRRRKAHVRFTGFCTASQTAPIEA